MIWLYLLVTVVGSALTGMICSRVWYESRVCAWSTDERGTFVPDPMSERIEHRDGVPFFEAPFPRWWHHCHVQSRGTLSFDGNTIFRCACGATRRKTDPRWTCRNESRGQRQPPLSDVPYVQRRQQERERWYALLNGMSRN